MPTSAWRPRWLRHLRSVGDWLLPWWPLGPGISMAGPILATWGETRLSGWRGSGYVRWSHPTNRGFLRALAGLARTAREIGEKDEEERCELFLRQLDPDWPDVDPPVDGSG